MLYLKSLKIIDHQVLQRLMVISFARNEIDKGIGSRMMLSSGKCEFLILYQLYSFQSIYEANKKIGAVAHVTAPLLFVESKNKKHVFVEIKACATDFLENQKFSMDL